MANFIVCLAHFCELHGPSIIVCTQIIDKEDREEYILPQNSKLQTCASCKLYLPGDNTNLISNSDLLGSKMFISTQYPKSQTRFGAVTKLAMKSLSVETSSDLTKPMFYGDTIYGYCVHKIFKIKDTNARGSERKYSFMIISDDESQLLLNWDIIGIYFNEIIALIQNQVDLTIEKNSKVQSDSAILDERYLRRSIVKPKSMIDLTGDQQIFVKFHLWAVELLKDLYR